MRFSRISRETLSADHPFLGIVTSPSHLPSVLLHSIMAIAAPSFPKVLVCSQLDWRYKESWGGGVGRAIAQPSAGSND